MRSMDGTIGIAASRTAFSATGATGRPITWRMTAVSEPQKFSEFDALLLAIAGHDIRQSLQIIQSAHELLGIGVPTRSELRHLAVGQIAIDRLTEQLDQLIGALRLSQHAKEMKLSPVRLEPLLRKACNDNQEAALKKGIEIRTASTSASIISDALLLGTVLRNLIGYAIEYTEPGGRLLVGCRRADQQMRIDVFETGSGIPQEGMSKIFDAFTRPGHTQRDGLGIGPFIVRQAIGVLGHRVDASSVDCRKSRFSIFAVRAEKTGEEAALT